MNKQLFRILCVSLAVIVCISVAVIYFTFDIRAVNYLSMFKPWSVLLAVLSLAIGFIFDGTRLITLTKLSGEKLDYKHVFNVVFSNYFLSLITPGQGGGGLAQLMFMKKAGVPVPKATLVVLVRTIMSIVFLFVMLPVVFYFDPALVGWLPTWMIVFVCVLFISLPCLTVYFMITGRMEKWLAKFCRRFSEKTQRAIFLWYRDFQQAGFLVWHNPWKVLRAFIESGLSLIFIYSVVPVFLYGFGLQVPYYVIMCRMFLLNLVLYFTPTPGGTGVAEGGFLVLFSSLVPSTIAGVTAILWRFFCEYVPFTVGAVLTIRSFGADVITQIQNRRNIDQ